MKLLTQARDLQRRKARERQSRFVAEGVRTVEALLKSKLAVHGLLVTSKLKDDVRGAALCEDANQRGIVVQEISEAELDDAADTDTPQGVLAIAEIPSRSIQSELASPPQYARYLVLDAIQDPGNVGTIVRTAAALGVTATFALPGTVDLWNAKVVRSAMGALFIHSAFSLSYDQLAQFLGDNHVTCWAADTDGVEVESLADSLPERIAVIVSNEGAGLTAQLQSVASQRIAIAMAPGVESLNVAVATGIVLHAIKPARTVAP